MPIEFIQQQQPTGSSSDTTRLVMMYDGSGRRISKTLLTKSAAATSWDTVKVTHYTGIGTEVREEFHDGSREKVNVVVNMPQGLGRYKVADASVPADDNASRTFEWYLKNHLGSTMLVYGTVASTDPNNADIGETKAAYDYRAFGEMVELMPHDLAKVTENFTGKELDDEIALDYFGARYLDPMLGMWISVDPARYFASPYVYMGNDCNPIRLVDEDGLEPGDGFDNVDNAVLDAGYFYQDIASMENAEYAGLIYELDGLFYSTNGVKGTEDASFPYEAEGSVPEGGKIVANWHNHGRHLESYGSGNYEMSDKDYENYKNHMIYMIPAKKVESNGLGRPVKRYNPVTGEEKGIGYVDKFSVRRQVNSSMIKDNHNRAER